MCCSSSCCRCEDGTSYAVDTEYSKVFPDPDVNYPNVFPDPIDYAWQLAVDSYLRWFETVNRSTPGGVVDNEYERLAQIKFFHKCLVGKNG